MPISPLQCKVEILRIAGQRIQKPERRPPVKGQRNHCSLLLQSAQHTCLQILADDVAPRHWRSNLS